MLSGVLKNVTFIRIWWDVFSFVLIKYKSPLKVIRIFKRIHEQKKKYNIQGKYKKIALVDGRVYLSPFNNGWPSQNFMKLIDIEARTALNEKVGNFEGLNMVQIALTKKCPLNCEHCYEGPELNKKDTLSLDDHKKIIKKLQGSGIPVIHYGGGDPMAKINDIIALLESADYTSDFWIQTSGFNLDRKNAQRLKKAGLTGVGISLDHFIPEYHNLFRRNEKAFQWAIDAAENAKRAGLVVNLSLCITRDFISRENFDSYLKLAGKIGASFVQLIEPRSVGNYEGKDVYLEREHIEIAETFFLEANASKAYKKSPIVLYPGYNQRRFGCAGAGEKFLYVDTDGYMSSCPFCRNKKTHILDDETRESSILSMRNEGCALVGT